MKSTRKIILSGVLLAIGLVLPPIVRLIPNAGVYISPMHIPALLGGLTVGPVYGLLVGLLCPILNNLLYGMPAGDSLWGMMAELPVYGLCAGLLMQWLKKPVKNTLTRVYISLIVAMILGRMAGGFMRGVVLGAQGYTVAVWITAYFVRTAPGIVIQLILIPAVYMALKKANLVHE